MGKREKDIRVEAHLSPEHFEQFKKIALEKQWSNKKLAENIIRDFLNAQKKGKK